MLLISTQLNINFNNLNFSDVKDYNRSSINDISDASYVKYNNIRYKYFDEKLNKPAIYGDFSKASVISGSLVTVNDVPAKARVNYIFATEDNVNDTIKTSYDFEQCKDDGFDSKYSDIDSERSVRIFIDKGRKCSDYEVKFFTSSNVIGRYLNIKVLSINNHPDSVIIEPYNATNFQVTRRNDPNEVTPNNFLHYHNSFNVSDIIPDSLSLNTISISKMIRSSNPSQIIHIGVPNMELFSEVVDSAGDRVLSLKNTTIYELSDKYSFIIPLPNFDKSHAKFNLLEDGSYVAEIVLENINFQIELSKSNNVGTLLNNITCNIVFKKLGVSALKNEKLKDVLYINKDSVSLDNDTILLGSKDDQTLIRGTFIKSGNTGLAHAKNLKFNSMEKQVFEIKSTINKFQTYFLNVDERIAHIEKVTSNPSICRSILHFTEAGLFFICPLASVALMAVEAGYNLYKAVKSGANVASIIDSVASCVMVLATAKNMSNVSLSNYDIPYEIAKTAVEYIELDELGLDCVVSNEINSEIDMFKLPPTGSVQRIHTKLADLPKSVRDRVHILASKVSRGEANPIERRIYNSLDKANVLPGHEYVRVSTYRIVNGTKFRSVYIYGVSEGFSTVVDGTVFGTKFDSFQTNIDANSIGSIRLDFSYNAGLSRWELVPWENYEFKQDLMEYLISIMEPEVAIDDYGKVISEWYEDVAINALNKDNLVLNEEIKLLTPGHLDLITNAIKSSAKNFEYSLIGNNCQDFSDSIINLINHPSEYPHWMDRSTYLEYITNLNSLHTNHSQIKDKIL
uniref:Minor structural protein n=1 Tax=Hubei reo-like virus 10 TaxID=1923173 RepID=A0A1L3KP41_9VIRU|nr:Minor structural protein [Hubei reo-like virus 10]